MYINNYMRGGTGIIAASPGSESASKLATEKPHENQLTGSFLGCWVMYQRDDTCRADACRTGAGPCGTNSARATSGSPSASCILGFGFSFQVCAEKLLGSSGYSLASDPAQCGDHAKCQAG